MFTTIVCDYCHLPVPVRQQQSNRDATVRERANQDATVRERLYAPPPATGDGLYCCYGCKLAAQITQARGEQGRATWMLTRLGVSVFLSMGVMVFSLALYGHEIYGFDLDKASPLAVSLTGLLRYFLLILATPVFLLLGLPILSNAIRSLFAFVGRSPTYSIRHSPFSTDVLVIVGVGAAFLYSYISTVTDSGKVYYETACMILVLVTLGRYLEAVGKLKASAAVESLHELLPAEVSIRRGELEKTVCPEEILIDDCVLIASGERIPVDGVVETGRAHVDEQIITGESEPVLRNPGDTVRAGTMNLDGALTVRASAVGSDSALGRLITLLEQAKRSKGRYERLADRAVSFFVPLTITLAIVAAAAGYGRGRIDEAIMSGLAVLLISCPCALGIATPMAIWVSLGRAAARGVLFRNGEAVEAIARVRAIGFDKTGTLTTGEPTIASFVTFPNRDATVGARKDSRTSGVPNGDATVGERANPVYVAAAPRAGRGRHEERVLAVAAGLGLTSTHTLARSVVAFARDRGITPQLVGDARAIPGRGIVGTIDETTVRLGNLAMMEEAGVSLSEPAGEEAHRVTSLGQGIVCVAEDQAVSGVFAFSETLRQEARPALLELRKLGCNVEILTGDHLQRGAAIAGDLGVTTHAALTPKDKIEHLRRMGRKWGMVAMVGDGLNDAPALAAADVGIAMGCGADLSRESAAICLLGNDLQTLPEVIRLARRTVRTIKLNLFWAFFYNAIGMSLALTGRLSPIFAAAAMVASSLFVVTNSMKLGRNRL